MARAFLSPPRGRPATRSPPRWFGGPSPPAAPALGPDSVPPRLLRLSPVIHYGSANDLYGRPSPRQAGRILRIGERDRDHEHHRAHQAELDIVEEIGAVVSLRKSGRAFKGLCPFHSERTPSFYVFPEKATWHCFGCDEFGDIFTFVQKQQGLDFREALQVLAERAGVPLMAARVARTGPTNPRPRPSRASACARLMRPRLSGCTINCSRRLRHSMRALPRFAWGEQREHRHLAPGLRPGW